MPVGITHQSCMLTLTVTHVFIQFFYDKIKFQLAMMMFHKYPGHYELSKLNAETWVPKYMTCIIHITHVIFIVCSIFLHYISHSLSQIHLLPPRL